MFKEGPKKGGFWYLAYMSAFPQWESKQVVPEMESLADWLWVFIHAHFATSFWIIKLIKYLYSGPCSWSRVPNLTASLTLDSNGSNEGSRWRRWMSHSVPSPGLLIKRMCKYTKQQEFHFSPVNIGTDKKTPPCFFCFKWCSFEIRWRYLKRSPNSKRGAHLNFDPRDFMRLILKFQYNQYRNE